VQSLPPVTFILEELLTFEIFPTPRVGKLGKNPAKMVKKKIFPNFDIFLTAYHKTSLRMIFHLNKYSCEMYRR
jgi:hypothetical protein